MSNLTDVDPADVRIGMRVEVAFVDTADGAAVPVFHPAATDERADERWVEGSGGDRRDRTDRVLASRGSERAAARLRVHHRGARGSRRSRRRRRRSRQLHHRPRRRDRARAFGGLPGDRMVEPRAVRRRWLDGRAAARRERGGERCREHRRRVPSRPRTVRREPVRRARRPHRARRRRTPAPPRCSGACRSAC